jgi:DNA-binding transcriptional ArsR family regulator
MRLKVMSEAAKEKLAQLRIDYGVQGDMECLAMVEFFPGAPISALARMTGKADCTIREHVRLLRKAHLVEIKEAKINNKATRLVYPRGMMIK